MAKLTDRPNPVLSLYENKLEGLKQEFSLKGLRPERNRELKRSLDEIHRVISELKSKSFLISDADPFIVVPSFMVGDNTEAFSPRSALRCRDLQRKDLSGYRRNAENQ
jgi:hypothetical protein